MNDDRLIQGAVEVSIAVIAAPHLLVRVRDGVVRLAGSVSHPDDRARAEDLAGRIEGVRAVVNDLVVEPIAAERDVAYQLELEAALEGVEQTAFIESPEADLNQPLGTTNPLRPEVQPDEPYFPPTDPVIEPASRTQGGYKVLGGYSESAMDQPLSAEYVPQRLERGDEQIAENVRLALKEDAATTDLDIHVHVRNGIVYLRGTVGYLQDVESAEEVASRVAGVREVREQLQLQ